MTGRAPKNQIRGKNNLVSVIIPAHNRLFFLEETVHSVTSQTYKNLEIIIVDDVSLPSVKDSLSINDPRIKIISNAKNLGPGASREIGRKIAVGNYLAFLDSDDYCHPQKIDAQVKLLRDHPNVGMCYCTTKKFAKLPINGDETIWAISDQSFTNILPIILYQRPWATGSCLWTREATDRIGEWSNFWVGEDIEYEARAGCLGIEITHLPKPFFFARRSDNNDHLFSSGLRQLGDGTGYLLSIASYILESQYSNNLFVRFRIIQKLLNQAVLLFDQDNKDLAVQCLQTVLRFPGINGSKYQAIIIYQLLSRFFPSRLVAKAGRTLRRYILPELNDIDFMTNLPYPPFYNNSMSQ